MLAALGLPEDLRQLEARGQLPAGGGVVVHQRHQVGETATQNISWGSTKYRWEEDEKGA